MLSQDGIGDLLASDFSGRLLLGEGHQAEEHAQEQEHQHHAVVGERADQLGVQSGHDG